MSAEEKQDHIAKTIPLYLSDAEIMKLVGVGESTWRVAVAALEPRGFPKKDPLMAGKRLWPAVKQFLCKRGGLDGTIGASDNEEETPL